MPHYLYGLVARGAPAPSTPGVDGREVSVRRLDEHLAVLRSTIEGPAVQPRRVHLTAHDRVLTAVMGSTPVLPLRFGIIASGDLSAVTEGLDTSAAVERMTRLAGKVEVHLLWEPDRDVSLRRVAARYPQVRDRRTSAVDRGRMISDAMSQLAVEDLRAAAEQLTNLTFTLDPVEARGSSARVAALIEADSIEAFFGACERLAERAVSAGSLRSVGPSPPYSFADLDRSLVRV